MGADEIMDWMVYELSISPEFQKKIKEEPKELTIEEESKALKTFFSRIGNKK